ncbi:MAG: hypothetical protein LBK01_06940 [Burkholderiaceae bacterium]|nr:hypothetical protein [Burkholderiaceae bacterium]
MRRGGWNGFWQARQRPPQETRGVAARNGECGMQHKAATQEMARQDEAQGRVERRDQGIP